MPKLLTGIASPVDIPEILEFWKHSKNASFSTAAAGMAIREYVSKNPFLCLVAEQDGKIVGTVVYGVKQYRGFIHHIAVEEKCLGSGVLTTLVNQAFTALAKRSCSRCHIFVHDMANNPVAKSIIDLAAWAHAGGSQIYTHDLEYPLSSNDFKIKMSN